MKTLGHNEFVLLQFIEESNPYNMIFKNCKKQLAKCLSSPGFEWYEIIFDSSSLIYGLYFKRLCKVLQNQIDYTLLYKIYSRPLSGNIDFYLMYCVIAQKAVPAAERAIK